LVLFLISLFGSVLFVDALGVGVGDLPLWALTFMTDSFGVLAVLSLAAGYLAVASIPYYFGVPRLRVERFDDEPVKKASLWQYSTRLHSTGMSVRFGSPFMIGARIVHD